MKLIGKIININLRQNGYGCTISFKNKDPNLSGLSSTRLTVSFNTDDKDFIFNAFKNGTPLIASITEDLDTQLDELDDDEFND